MHTLLGYLASIVVGLDIGILIVYGYSLIRFLSDIWYLPRHQYARYPILASALFAAAAFFFVILVWPAGEYKGTLEFVFQEKLLLGYFCVASMILIPAYNLGAGGARLPLLHYLGALVLGILMACFG